MAVSRQLAANGNLAAEKLLELHAPPTRITLISHAVTVALKRASFPMDEPLTEGETEKIASVGWAAPRAQHVWCGSERRTQETAKALGLEPAVSIDLGEVNYGTWQGREIGDIQANDPEGLADWLTNVHAVPHGGESLAQLIARIRKWMECQTNAGHVVAVTHPAVIRAAILSTMQAPLESFWRIEIAPLSVTDLRFNGKLWTVRSTGCSIRGS